MAADHGLDWITSTNNSTAKCYYTAVTALRMKAKIIGSRQDTMSSSTQVIISCRQKTPTASLHSKYMYVHQTAET